MLKSAYNTYEQYANGCDELDPIEMKCNNWYSNGKEGLLATPVDSLDTLFIAGLHEEYERAKELVLTKLDIHKNISMNVFESNIRILGGLLSAYELDHDSRYIEKAKEIADVFLFAFKTPSGFPMNIINPATYTYKEQLMFRKNVMSSFKLLNPNETDENTVNRFLLAEIGTMQMEMQYLSDITGIKIYQEQSLFVWEQLEHMNKRAKKEKVGLPGLYPIILEGIDLPKGSESIP